MGPSRRILHAYRRAEMAAAVLVIALGVVATFAHAQTAPVTAAPVAAAPRPAASNGKAAMRPITRPQWRELTPAQQQSLAPLSVHWDSLNEPQKRKWIAMASNFHKMPPAEQAKLHSRMTEWVSLSPQQRTQARLNWGETKKISVDDKKAKWEAYQQLPPEEKKRLASGVAKTPSTAAALRPVSPDKLAAVPRPRPAQQEPQARLPRIAAAPHQVDHNTLLPQPQPAPAPVTN